MDFGTGPKSYNSAPRPLPKPMFLYFDLCFYTFFILFLYFFILFYTLPQLLDTFRGWPRILRLWPASRSSEDIMLEVIGELNGSAATYVAALLAYCPKLLEFSADCFCHLAGLSSDSTLVCWWFLVVHFRILE